MPALSALHSAVQSFAVFKPVAVVCLGAAGDAVSAGLAAGAAADGSAPPLHCSTYALSVTPRACIPALSARHSAVHSFAVFAKAGVTEILQTTAAAITKPLWIFIFILLILCLLTRYGRQIVTRGNDCSYTATEPRTSGRKEAAAGALFVTPSALFNKAVFPIRD
jgi:ribose/xylose/arabinose/galactoside ABC-type transport system permease subunit